MTGKTVELAFVDQGYTGAAAEAAAANGIRLKFVKLAEAKKGFVLLPRWWVVEQSFGWAARFRRLARDYEAFARDLILEYVYQVKIRRWTEGIDFGVAVRNWDEFENLKKSLVATSKFKEDKRIEHRIWWKSPSGDL